MGLEDNITSSKYVENTVSNWMKHFVIVTENSTKDAQMGAKETYDGMGAMQYIVAVVLIYSTAVIGVFVLGFVSRRHKQNVQIDKQANFFLKDINQTRIVIERQERKKSIASYLRSSSVDFSSSASDTVRNSLLTAVAIPMTSLSMTSNYHKAGYRRSISAPLFRIPESHSENCSGNEIENDKIENFQSYDELDSTKVKEQAENCSLLVNPHDNLKESCFIEEESLGNFGLHGTLDTTEHPQRQALLKECNGDRTIPFSDYTCS